MNTYEWAKNELKLAREKRDRSVQEGGRLPSW